MRNLLGFLCIVFLSASCMEVDGTLNVKQDVTFQNVTIETANREQDMTVPAGNYRAQLEFKSRERVVLEIKDFYKNNRDIDIEFDIPKGSGIPQDNGNFFLSAADVGQPYDIAGEVNTDITRSPRRYDQEQCTYTDYERRCQRVCRNVCRTRPDGRRVCRQRCENRCRNVRVTKWGWRDIEYHVRTEEKDYEVEILVPGTNTQAAVFQGDYRNSQTIIDYRGMCSRYRR